MIANLIGAGAIDVGLACGVEHMSKVWLGANVPRIDDTTFVNGSSQASRLRPATCPTSSARPNASPNAEASPASASTCSASISQQKAIRATDEGRFEREIIPVDVTLTDGTDVDRQPRPGVARDHRGQARRAQPGRCPTASTPQATRRRSATARRPCSGWTRRGPTAEGLRPRARLVAQCLVGSDPYYHLDGPVDATAKLFEMTGMTMDDIDIVEINEAFASVVLSWAQVDGISDGRSRRQGQRERRGDRLGHPVGSTGSRLITTALHELERRDAEFAMITMCCGGAVATGTIIQRI